ncbi:MAG: RNA methyltransferase [Bacteroidota bacterium]
MRKLQNEELNRLSVDEFKNKQKNPFVLVLDNVRSMHNVGSAFRTADAFLVEKLYLCGITATPPHRDINKTALGATESVAWEHAADVIELVKRLKAEGWIIVAIEQADKSVLLHQFEPQQTNKYCFIFGNEVFGVSEEVVALADICVEIPQFGSKHSLNVSVSIGILCWDYVYKTQC